MNIKNLRAESKYPSVGENKNKNKKPPGEPCKLYLKLIVLVHQLPFAKFSWLRKKSK
jgi:hypothetical protein